MDQFHLTLLMMFCGYFWGIIIAYMLCNLKRIQEEDKMEENNMKEVYYDQYCKTCEHSSKAEDDEPCRECLDEPARPESHKPLKWEEKIGRK